MVHVLEGIWVSFSFLGHTSKLFSHEVKWRCEGCGGLRVTSSFYRYKCLIICSLKNAPQLDIRNNPDMYAHQAHSKRLSSMGTVVVRIPQCTKGNS